LVIDIGAVKKISGIKYVARQDGKNGRMKDYRLYFSSIPFLIGEIEISVIIIVRLIYLNPQFNKNKIFLVYLILV
jgi:hypothetical protein